MTRKYNRVMEHISLSDEQKNQILQNIADTDFDAVKPVQQKKVSHKKQWTAALTFAAIAAVAVILPNAMRMGAASSAESTSDGELLLSNSAPETSASSESEWISYDSAASLSSASGITIREVDQPGFEVKQTSYYFNDETSTAIIVYTGDDNTLTVYEEDRYITPNSRGSYGVSLTLNGSDVSLYSDETDSDYVSADINGADGMHDLIEYAEPVDKDVILSVVKALTE